MKLKRSTKSNRITDKKNFIWILGVTEVNPTLEKKQQNETIKIKMFSLDLQIFR